MATALAAWRSDLLATPWSLSAIEASLVPEFSASGLQPNPTQVRRSGAIEVTKRAARPESRLDRGLFLAQLQRELSVFSQVLTAEFQIIRLDSPAQTNGPAPPPLLKTRVVYSLVGHGQDFHREQHSGEWDLEWQATAAGYKIARWDMLGETVSRANSPLFADFSSAALGANPSYTKQLLHGSDYWRTTLDGASGIDIYGHNGVSLADIDNDGLDDLYVCQPAGLPNRLYRNRGDGTFEDITERSGLGILENTACALFADFNNDGRQDVIVVRTNGPLLLLNQGGGKFRPQPDAFHFATPPQGTFTGAAVADYDRDGWLDIYFCLYTYYQGTDQYKYPVPYHDAENGPPNFLMRNNRNGTFRDVTAESKLNQNNTRYSFCCTWNDYNNDGWPDLYVVNDFGRKNLYRNNGNGTFTDIAAEAGVEDVGAGMSVCWADFFNRGLPDLYVANMWTAAGQRVSTESAFLPEAPETAKVLFRKHAMGNSLLRNNGDGTFADISAKAGIGPGRWSWSSDAWDFDHDGFPDLYVTNGMVSGNSQQDLNSFFWRQVVANSPTDQKPTLPYEQGWNAINVLIRSDKTWSGMERNVVFLNNRDETFADISGITELDFFEDGRAFALADFDGDGRQELFLKSRNSPQLRVLKNVIPGLPPSITLSLRGTKSNRDAIGAVVSLKTEAGQQTRTVQAGSGFLSQHSKALVFGLGEAKSVSKLSIRWPSGLSQELHDLPLNHTIRIEEGSPSYEAKPYPRSSQPAPSIAARNVPKLSTEPLPTNVETWLLTPVVAPDFSFTDSSGKTQALSAVRGKPALLTFWSPDAEKCGLGSHELESLNRALHLQNLRWLLIQVADQPKDPPTHSNQLAQSLPLVQAASEVGGIYNVLFGYLFDRHRDLPLPTSFLLNGDGEIVKLYQGALVADGLLQDISSIPRTPAERISKALPFPGIADSLEFTRNYISFGSIYFQRGYFDQARASFERALRDDPSSAEALYGLGSVYLNQQKNDPARQAFQRALELTPNYPDTLPNAWNNLGLLNTREKQMANAIDCFQQALRLNPNHFIALLNLGNAYRHEKNWEEARNILGRAIAVNPDNAEANYSLAMVFAQLNQSDRAYELLQRALQIRPEYPEALNNLGVLYLHTGQRDEAVAKFQECIRVAPEFNQSYLNLARVYAVEGKTDESRRILLELLRHSPNDEQAKAALAELSR